MQHGFESLLPPLVAIALAILTRRVLLPLAAGAFIGAAILTSADADANWLDCGYLFAASLWKSVWDFDHLQTLAFTLLLGAMVGVMEFGGGIRALILMLSRRIQSRCGAQVMIALSGLAIFFDDYANTLLIGGTMRSTVDRYGISRAKLAYLVDSTAAPVAGLSVVSTWTAIEISYMADGLQAAGITDPSAAFALFLESIPYRFYPVLAIVMVLLVSATGRDFGPMRAIEQRRFDEGNRLLTDAAASSSNGASPRLWLAAVLPILSCLTAILTVLILTGRQSATITESMTGIRAAVEILGNGNSYLALISGGAVGLALALCSHLALADCGPRRLFEGVYRGAMQMMPAMLILWLAWALSAMTQQDALDTGGYLASILSERLDPRLLPSAVFLISGFVAFSTGTSWGTMAILTPLSITLSLSLDPTSDPSGAICLATAGSVLAGAILGDHCSPISDTTVLSSRSSGCDHLQHVQTQMPYAIVVAIVAVLCGCMPAAIGVSPWLLLTAGSIVLAIIVRVWGQTPELKKLPPEL
ncbi:Na+/H+ antiporter NhaC family protein [Novipirellula artificiosorum]|uniref:Malate-2H(+)/Na(+)-lactate antiporter n=1 Tax=Novipirellula artificiosorum TaxID=2528016 RepID=A0A5C6DZD6_9BACT|nr:Na+/H+ antiporter NhaC family protein [Novipirellula artificiosorum]TWU41972.1 Malate-2H(+)/Na(+)-lactate antiporter [Novipirellula artificiosorum]